MEMRVPLHMLGFRGAQPRVIHRQGNKRNLIPRQLNIDCSSTVLCEQAPCSCQWASLFFEEKGSEKRIDKANNKSPWEILDKPAAEQKQKDDGKETPRPVTRRHATRSPPSFLLHTSDVIFSHLFLVLFPFCGELWQQKKKKLSCVKYPRTYENSLSKLKHENFNQGCHQ